MNLSEYLTSKKIDAAAFQQAEPELWKTWSDEFEQMHPNSFTVQKLNLINPIRRKYPLKTLPDKSEDNLATPTSSTESTTVSKPATSSSNPKPSIPKPVFKPKPKMS